MNDMSVFRRPMRYGRLTVTDEKSAILAGAWFLAINGNERAARFAEQNGVPIVKAVGEFINSAGGFLAPDELMRTVIALRETRGAFRACARIAPMSSDSASVARRTGGLTAFFTAENAALTETSASW